MALIKNALANLKTSKLRVFVAMVWIILGITSVVIVASVGDGLEAKIAEASDDEKERTVSLDFSANNSEAAQFLEPFNKEILEAISLTNGVERVDLSNENAGSDTLFHTALRNEGNESFVVLTPKKDVKRVKLEYGRDFGYEDEERKVIIIGPQTATNLFGSPQDAIGKPLEVEGRTFEVIGIASIINPTEYEQMSSEQCYLPLKASQDIQSDWRGKSTVGLSSINIVISPGFDVMNTAWNISDNLSAMYSSDDGHYFVNSSRSELSELQDFQNMISQVTSLLMAVCLTIGGIGIMNIMFLSVTERKREIGIRRAIGAKPKNIITQFLIESVVITSLGGIIGIGVAMIASVVISNVLPFKLVPTVEAYIYAVGASMLIGVVFGIIPAFKASRIDPIKAIQG